MTSGADRADSLPMSNEARGKALYDRMVSYGLDRSKLARKTGKDVGTIRRVLEGTAADTTYDQVEKWFEREDAKNNAEMPAAQPGDHVVIRLEEGGSLVVEGPTETSEQREILKEFAREMIREWRAKPPTP
jgi:hypothetical protein